MSTIVGPIEPIATLSDEYHLTCSYDAATRLAPSGNIVSCSSFEEAADLLKHNKVNPFWFLLRTLECGTLLWTRTFGAPRQLFARSVQLS